MCKLKKSYDFMEPPLFFPSDTLQQSGPDGLYFDWVGLCKNGTLTFGRETGDNCKILLSCEIYPENGCFHEDYDLREYWKSATKYLRLLKELNPQFYYQILDLMSKYNVLMEELT